MSQPQPSDRKRTLAFFNLIREQVFDYVARGLCPFYGLQGGK